MKRSEINALVDAAAAKFRQAGWSLPPKPRWDVTDFGLGDHTKFGLVLVNLAEEPEYCEKLMYAKRGMLTPAHCHAVKKEDIICRDGRLRVRIWAGKPQSSSREISVKVCGEPITVPSGSDVFLNAGERITLVPGVYHEFEPVSEECVIGEVSTANDDEYDNFFVDENVGRYPEVVEDEPPRVRLLSDK